MKKDENVEVGNSTPHEKNVFSSSEKKFYHSVHAQNSRFSIHTFFFKLEIRKWITKRTFSPAPEGLHRKWRHVVCL